MHQGCGLLVPWCSVICWEFGRKRLGVLFLGVPSRTSMTWWGGPDSGITYESRAC